MHIDRVAKSAGNILAKSARSKGISSISPCSSRTAVEQQSTTILLALRSGHKSLWRWSLIAAVLSLHTHRHTHGPGGVWHQVRLPCFFFFSSLSLSFSFLSFFFFFFVVLFFSLSLFFLFHFLPFRRRRILNEYARQKRSEQKKRNERIFLPFLFIYYFSTVFLKIFYLFFCT